MTPPSGRAVLSGRVQNAAGQGEDGAAAFDAGPVWMRALPPVVMLAMALWRITGPSYWRDEAATLTATARPFGELLRMMGQVDAVHGLYYMIIWVVVRLGGTGELVTRLPSAVAMACAAAAVAALGRRLVPPRAGLTAGLLFAFLPQISLYAQDVREYALVTALATTGSYLLVRALTAAGRWLAAAAGAFLLASPVLALGIAAWHAELAGDAAAARHDRRAQEADRPRRRCCWPWAWLSVSGSS